MQLEGEARTWPPPPSAWLLVRCRKTQELPAVSGTLCVPDPEGDSAGSSRVFAALQPNQTAR